ncbi:MAG: hypothetical protein JSS49_25950 [Planctomycetes bacterium]|nr:hypothetical protein [Planctomycetota bacterium]
MSTVSRGATGICAALVASLPWMASAIADDPPTTSKSAIVQVSATAPSALAPVNSILLAYKFQPGQFVNYTGASRIQYLTQLADQTFHNVQTNQTETHFRVVTVDEQGFGLIEPVVDRTRMMAKVGDKPAVEFDSASSAETSPQFRTIRDAIGHPVARFQVTPTGKLVKATIVDSTAPIEMREAAEKLDTRFVFLPILPATPVSVGEKWREEYSTIVVNDGLKQPIPIRRIYELVSVADGIATIKFKTLIMTPLHDAEMEKQLLQQTPVGTIEFDLDRGLVRSYRASIDRTAMNAFGQESLLKVTGETIEKLVADGSQPTPH